MKRFRTYFTALSMLVLASAMAVSCTERLSEEVIVSGSRANIQMTINADTKLSTSSSDRLINNLTLMVFDNQGSLVSKESVDYNNSPIRLNTVSGSNSRIVTIANSDTNLDAQLKAINSYAQIAQLVVQASENPLKGGNLLMVGDSTMNIKPGDNAITLPMSFVCSKVEIKIDDNLKGGESFIINSCKLVSMPSSTFLLERTSDVQAGYAERFVAWETKEKTTNIEFFMFENRRGVRGVQPDEKENEQHLNKRRYALPGSSYIVVNATHRTATGSATFDMYLYFGQNNATDYNINRSENHKYTIGVKGFNNISIDSNIEYSNNNFDVVYGDNLIFDAHYDSRQVLLKNGNGMVDVEVRDGNGRKFNEPGFNASWVKISPLDLARPQIRQKGNGSKSEWQQDGSADHYVRGKYIPHKSVRNQLAGGWNYVDIDNDDVMNYKDASYRMCYGINNVPVSTLTSLALHIYASENTTGNQRRAQVIFSSTDNKGETKTQMVTIYQQGGVYVGNINGYQMYIETGEENSMALYADGLPFLNPNPTMQWGYSSSLLNDVADKFTNGAFLTASAVYGPGESRWVENDSRFVQKNSDGTPLYGALTYRPKYAAGLGGFDKVAEPYEGSKLNTSGAPYYYPTPQYWSVTFNPLYGSSAARYCHEKNRDLNGDGVINSSEAVWYLPSFNELEQIWIAQNGINGEHRLSSDGKYWSSTEFSNNRAFAVSMKNGAMYDQAAKSGQARVRCVRRGAKSSSAVEVESGVVVNNSDLPSGAITELSKGAAPTTESMNQTVYARFAIANSDLRGLTWSAAMGYPSNYDHTAANNLTPSLQTGCAGYSESVNGSDKGSWRLPTSRELMRIYILANEINSARPNGGRIEPMSTENAYWSSSEGDYWGAWGVHMSPQSFTPEPISRATKLNVRCIKELL